MDKYEHLYRKKFLDERSASWHRLWLELGRYLIAFRPLTYVLD